MGSARHEHRGYGLTRRLPSTVPGPPNPCPQGEWDWPQRDDASGELLPPTPHQMRQPDACPRPAPAPRTVSARSSQHASWTQFPTLG
eukprot:326118-Pleurochrysis_carterae.AAC.1